MGKVPVGKIAGANPYAKAGQIIIEGAVKVVSDGSDNYLEREKLIGKLSMLSRGNNTNAQLLYSTIKDFATQTPISLDEAGNGVSKLLQSGSQLKEINSELKVLGDISTGSYIGFNKIVELYSKAKTLGKISEQDLDNLGENSSILLRALGEQFNTDEKGLRNLINTGRVGFPQLEEAFKRLTTAGGQFYGAMETENQSYNSVKQNFEDNYKITTGNIGEHASSLMKGVFDLGISALGGTNNTSKSLLIEATKGLGSSIYTDGGYSDKRDIIYIDEFGNPTTGNNWVGSKGGQKRVEEFSDNIFNELKNTTTKQGLRDLLRRLDDASYYLGQQKSEGKISNKLYINEQAILNYAYKVIGNAFRPDIKLNEASAENSNTTTGNQITLTNLIGTMNVYGVDSSIPTKDIKDKVGRALLDLINDVNQRTK